PVHSTFFLILRPPPFSPLFPYTTLFRSYFLREIPPKYHDLIDVRLFGTGERIVFEPYTREMFEKTHRWMLEANIFEPEQVGTRRSEEHTSELQSRFDLVCRLLLEKKKIN